MKKIDKFQSKLSPKIREKVNDCLLKIKERNFENLDLKKLQGFENLYRVRIGQIRIVFSWKGNDTEIITIDNRNDNTYNF